MLRAAVLRQSLARRLTPLRHAWLTYFVSAWSFFSSLAVGKGQPPGPPVLNSLGSPHVRMLGPDHALICYTRVNQNGAKISAAQETRVWQREGGRWKNIHFHRSPLARL